MGHSSGKGNSTASRFWQKDESENVDKIKIVAILFFFSIHLFCPRGNVSPEIEMTYINSAYFLVI